MARGDNSESTRRTRRPPAPTPDAREKQLIGLAYDEAERQIRAGGATSQLLTHFLKAGTERERLERLRLEREVALLQAKTEVLGKTDRMETLMNDALSAMRTYSGRGIDEEYID